MAGRGPGVQRPQPGQNREAHEHQRKRPALERFRKRKLRQLDQVKRRPARHDISRDQPNEHHPAADKRIKRQLHRAVLLVGRAPDGDEKVFRDDRQLVKQEQKKQIKTEEHAIDSADEGKIEGEKFTGAFLDVPGK